VSFAIEDTSNLLNLVRLWFSSIPDARREWRGPPNRHTDLLPARVKKADRCKSVPLGSPRRPEPAAIVLGRQRCGPRCCSTCQPDERDPNSGRPVPHCDGTGLCRALCL